MPEEEQTTNARTLDELYDVVANGFDSVSSVDSDGFVALGNKLDDVLGHIQSSQAAEGTTEGTIVLDQAQIQMLHDGISVLTTETFLLVVLLATLCGLCGWIILARGWFK